MSNERVRKVDTNGIITTIAGCGDIGDSGDGGPAVLAKFKGIYGLTIDDSGNLFVADWDAGKIRKISKYGIITAYAGTGTFTYNGDNILATEANIGPLKITFNHNGELYVVDNPGDRIRMIDKSGIIHTVAGNGVCCYSGDFGPADSAEIGNPSGVAFDSCGNMYITQVDNPRIRKVTFPYCNYNGITDLFLSRRYSLFPNPATTTLTLQSPEHLTALTITNYLGKTLHTQTLHGEAKAEIDIGYLPSGMYFIHINNNRWERFVKE